MISARYWSECKSRKFRVSNRFGISSLWLSWRHLPYPSPLHSKVRLLMWGIYRILFEELPFGIESSADKRNKFHIVVIGGGWGCSSFLKRNGWEMKYLLCKAAIEGIKAIRKIRPTAEVFLVELLIWVHPMGDFRSASGRARKWLSVSNHKYNHGFNMSGTWRKPRSGRWDWSKLLLELPEETRVWNFTMARSSKLQKTGLRTPPIVVSLSWENISSNEVQATCHPCKTDPMS